MKSVNEPSGRAWLFFAGAIWCTRHRAGSANKPCTRREPSRVHNRVPSFNRIERGTLERHGMTCTGHLRKFARPGALKESSK